MISRRALVAGASSLIASPAMAFPVIGTAPRGLDSIIRRGGAWDACALCLDAGMAASHISGNAWNDLTANGRDFTASGPTFTGDPGQVSDQYWAFGGSEYFDGTNDSFFNGLHKDGASWGFLAHIYIPELTGNNVIIGTTSSSSNPGVRVLVNSGEALRLQVGNGSGIQTIHSSTERLNVSEWNTVGLVFDEGGGASASVSYVNGITEAFDGAVTSPSASNPSDAVQIGAHGGNGGNAFEDGVRLAALAMFDTPSIPYDLFHSIMSARL